MRQLLAIFILIIFQPWGAVNAAPLPAEKAFAMTAYVNEDDQIILKWTMPSGYFIYRDKLKIIPAEQNKASIKNISYPRANLHNKVGEKIQVYEKELLVTISLLANEHKFLSLNIFYQGCSSDGFCYTPLNKNLSVNLDEIKTNSDITQYIAKPHDRAFVSSQDKIKKLLQQDQFYLIIPSFLLFGLLLAFTPCVLPMIPILSSIIVGQRNKLNAKKAFCLSFSYVIGMSLAYAFAGILIALLGSNIQVMLQKPGVIIFFSILFFILALSLFGLFEIRLPRRLQNKILTYNQKHKSGTYAGVFLMGAFSTLVVSPCVSAPLVGVLAYIGNSGSLLLGAAALFFLGLGMGMPLLLIGTSAGKFIPKSGPWMNSVNQLFGFFMLAVAIWMLSRIVKEQIILVFWGVCFFAFAFFVWNISHNKNKYFLKIKLALEILSLYFGIILLGSVITHHPYWLKYVGLSEHAYTQDMFIRIEDMKQLEKEFEIAKQKNQFILLDYYADWCTSCIMMDKNVFSKERVKKELKSFRLLRADVTHNNAFDQEILKRFNVIAPPTILFFNPEESEFAKKMIVGEVNANKFISTIAKITGSLICNKRNC